jgi:beta-glucosidase/6-phospho-beta-glucosidase/beta-galactosidase
MNGIIVTHIIEISENLARPLKIPIFIAENGIATTDDKKRAQFYHEYLYAIYKAFQDGYPIFGYLPWTLADNYEWPTPENNTKRDYGLCAVPAPEKLVAKEGSKPYFAFTQQLHQLERAP